MLWEYFYIGSEMVKSSIEDLCPTWPTSESRRKTSHSVAELVQDIRRNKKMKAGASKKKDKNNRSTGVEEVKGLGTLLALEPRIMFDGAALLTGAEVLQDTTTQDQTAWGKIAPTRTSNSYLLLIC